MKKVKYYYSEPVHLRMLPVVTGAQGDPLYIVSTKTPVIKTLPRITVAAVLNDKEGILTFGSAVCAPGDVFKKSIGRELALKRAKDFPEIKIRLTKRNKISKVSKRYADQLISQHLQKYVCADI